MNSSSLSRPKLAAVLSSLITQLTLLTVHLLQPLTTSPSTHITTLLSIHHHLLHSLSTLTLLPRHKRRRTLPSSPSPTLFNMTPQTFRWLSGLLEPLLECRDPVNLPLSLTPDQRLAIGLYRLSSGSGYSDISARFEVPPEVAEFCCMQLCRVLCTNYRFWVGYPDPDELCRVSARFEDLTGLPNCCGVLTCTRFMIMSKNSSDNDNDSNNEEQSVAAQIVVDSSSRILNIVVGHRGDKSDLRVLKGSALYEDVESGRLLNSNPIHVGGVSVPQYVVTQCGDGGGYPLLPWLMVPYNDPKQESDEERFNKAVARMNVPVVKTVASLRNWGILSKPIEDEFRNAVVYIGACAILHNALLMREDYSSLCDNVDDYMVGDHRVSSSINVQQVSVEASLIRNALATKAKD